MGGGRVAAFEANHCGSRKALCCTGNSCNKNMWVLTVSLSFPTALTQTTYGATKLGMLKRLGAWEMVSLKRFQIENHNFFSSLAGFLLDAASRLFPYTHDPLHTRSPHTASGGVSRR